MADGIVFDENGIYIPQEWLDGVGDGNFTPINAERMNHIEQGIRGLSEAWDSQSQDIIKSYSFEQSVSLGAYSFATIDRTLQVDEGYRLINSIGISTFNTKVTPSAWYVLGRNRVIVLLQNTDSSAMSGKMTVHVEAIRG